MPDFKALLDDVLAKLDAKTVAEASEAPAKAALAAAQVADAAATQEVADAKVALDASIATLESALDAVK